jgi:hypothetical protein
MLSQRVQEVVAAAVLTAAALMLSSWMPCYQKKTLS